MKSMRRVFPRVPLLIKRNCLRHSAVVYSGMQITSETSTSFHYVE